MSLTVVAVLDEAQRHLDEFDPETSGAWPHAAAALIRQSLESTLDVFWGRKQPEMVDASARDRWVCLPAFLGDARRRAPPTSPGARSRRPATTAATTSASRRTSCARTSPPRVRSWRR